MIKRAPRPDRGFLILHNDTAREPRITYRASGILHDILSRPDNWTASAESLAAARPGGEGVKAIRTALRELEAAGYLRRERVRGEDGRFGWVQTVYDMPVLADPEPEPDVSAGQAISPFPPGGFVQGGNGPSKEEPRRSTEKTDELNCIPSGRFAPSGAGDEDGHEQESFSDWRSEDHALFKTFISGRIESDGSTWTAGVFTADAVYGGMRRHGKKKIPWPGRYVRRVAANQHDETVEDWLSRQGLKMVE